MLKKQPSVCAGDYSEEDMYEWIQQKAKSIEQLKSARASKEFLQRELDTVDKLILSLTSDAALEYSTHKQAATHPDVDERTSRDVSVLIYLLEKPTGDAAKDAENAALADMYRAALKSGKIVGFISDNAPGVSEARKALGQACVETIITIKKSEIEKIIPDKEMISVDKELFKELLQLILNLPDFGSKLAAIDIDSGPTSTSETFVRLKPSDFLLRLSAALGACG
ncbi:hypothetical protein [Citrobacter sp. RHBSTW-00986]|uniref:hypothetical protein n=1 Tax=Citrobacter sp. RHBSTW-00986 TaxID=2742675 RepID=UPI0021084477|nr:hypothetical protein [Citrobacter sp. RHBSTW-00986]